MIQKAKAEYVKKTMPRESKTEGGGGECEISSLWGLEGLGRALRMALENGTLAMGFCIPSINGVGWVANPSVTPVITDPMDSKFDLEAYLTLKMADEAK